MAFTSLGWTKLTSNQSSISINLPAGYQDILVKFAISGDRASEDYLIMRLSGNSGNNYMFLTGHTDGSTQTLNDFDASGLTTTDSFRVGYIPPSSLSYSRCNGIVNLLSYADSNVYKAVTWQSAYENTVTSGTVKQVYGGGYYNTKSTLTSVSFHPVYGTNLLAGSTVAVYGYTKS